MAECLISCTQIIYSNECIFLWSYLLIKLYQVRYSVCLNIIQDQGFYALVHIALLITLLPNMHHITLIIHGLPFCPSFYWINSLIYKCCRFLQIYTPRQRNAAFCGLLDCICAGEPLFCYGICMPIKQNNAALLLCSTMHFTLQCDFIVIFLSYSKYSSNKTVNKGDIFEQFCFCLLKKDNNGSSLNNDLFIFVVLTPKIAQANTPAEP